MSRPGVSMRRVAVALTAVSLLAGCSSLGGFTGAAAGIASGTVTSNPAVGIAVGVAVRAGTDAAVQTVFRRLARNEQAVIAGYAGEMQVGEGRTWATHHRFGFGDASGQMLVVSASTNALTSCKEVAITVDDDKAPPGQSQWFLTHVCLQTQGRWLWAAAEPAVGRWGALH